MPKLGERTRTLAFASLMACIGYFTLAAMHV